MDKQILERLKALEKKYNPKDAMVKTFFPGDTETRIISLPDFCKRCRCDSMIYDFQFVGEGNEEQIDLLIDLIDLYANDEL